MRPDPVLATVREAKKDPNTKGGEGMLEDQMIAGEKAGERKDEEGAEKTDEHKKALQEARNFIKLRVVNLEQIAKVTGLPVEEVRSIVTGR